MSETKPFCLMPWIHFHVGNNGIAKACCVANIPFGNVNEKTLEEIWQDEPIQKLREKFSKGEKDNRCAQCINLEAAGGKSIRQETFEKFSQSKIDFSHPQLPVYFDIRFSNVCNFRCRTCWHGASSKWYSDAKTLGRNIGEKAILQNIHDFDIFLEKNGKALLQCEEIYFAGGEPLVTEEHYLLLNFLIKNNATHMRLRYNTNFSKLKFKEFEVIEMWKHFPKVELLASIDGVGALGEMIRKEMNWQQIIQNRELIIGHENINFKISPTVSVYNIFHLPELYQKCLELNMIQPDDFYINILERPIHFNIKILPLEKKIVVVDTFKKFFQWLEQQGFPNSIRKMFEEILQFMNAEDLSKNWEKFQVESQLLDDLRNEDALKSLIL